MPPAPDCRAALAADTANPTAAAFHHADGGLKKFPTRAVVILALAMTINSYTMVSLFPYVGMMVKELLNLESTNEVGETR